MLKTGSKHSTMVGPGSYNPHLSFN